MEGGDTPTAPIDIESPKGSRKKTTKSKSKTEISMSPSEKVGKIVVNSENFPLVVDYLPENEVFLNDMGRIGMCMAPGRKKKSSHKEWDRNLHEDLSRLKNIYHCDVVVSLVRNSELHTLKIQTLFEDIENMQMQSIHFPITDKWIPESMTELIKLVIQIIQKLKEGKNIVVHCNGGKGRAATVTVATLIALGKGVKKSIELVRKARSGTIRNPIQIIYVKRFKKAWKAFLRKKLKAQGAEVKLDDEELEKEIEQVDDDSDDIDVEDLMMDSPTIDVKKKSKKEDVDLKKSKKEKRHIALKNSGELNGMERSSFSSGEIRSERTDRRESVRSDSLKISRKKKDMTV